MSASVAIFEIRSRSATNGSRSRAGGLVTSGNCETLGNFPQGWFYIYAEQTNTGQQKVWEGDFPNSASSFRGRSIVSTAGTTCTADNLKQFTSELVPSTTGTFTYTLR